MKLSNAWNWELGIGILEDNVFGQPEQKIDPQLDPLIEKRKEARISFSLPVKYKKKGLNFPWIKTQSVDISRNGVRLALDHEVPVGTEIDLDIKLPEIQKNVQLQGVIVWASPSSNGTGVTECGIAFKNIRKLSNKEKLIYFMADKICSLAERNSRHFNTHLAKDKSELDSAFALIYKEYVAKKYCPEHASKMHYSYHSMLPDSRTFIIEKDNEMIGTISLIPDSNAGLPLDSIFGEELGRLRKPGHLLAEVSLLALKHDNFQKKTFSLTDFQKLTSSFRLFKTMFDYARAVGGVTDFVIGMHPKHKDLYNYLNFNAIGPVKSYPGAEGKPALLMHLDIEETLKSVSVNKSAGQFFLTSSTPKEEFESFLKKDADLVADYLFNKKELIRYLDTNQQKNLKSLYPDLVLPKLFF